MKQNLNELAAEIHKDNHNWWHDLETGEPLKRNEGELLMLVVTELAEAAEGIRKNLSDDKLPHRKMEEVEMADAKIRLLDFAGGFKLKLFKVSPQVIAYIGGIKNKMQQIITITRAITDVYYRGNEDGSDEVSIAIALIEKYCEIHGLDLDGAVAEKRAYNKTRIDHSVEHRKSTHGKKF